MISDPKDPSVKDITQGVGESKANFLSAFGGHFYSWTDWSHSNSGKQLSPAAGRSHGGELLENSRKLWFLHLIWAGSPLEPANRSKSRAQSRKAWSNWQYKRQVGVCFSKSMLGSTFCETTLPQNHLGKVILRQTIEEMKLQLNQQDTVGSQHIMRRKCWFINRRWEVGTPD